jgi:hypothetical protein
MTPKIVDDKKTSGAGHVIKCLCDRPFLFRGHRRKEDPSATGYPAAEADTCLKNYFRRAVLLSSRKSTITNAAMASTMGTALGTTQGSCRPLPSTITLFPLLSMLSWSFMMVATGLKAILK